MLMNHPRNKSIDDYNSDDVDGEDDDDDGR